MKLFAFSGKTKISWHLKEGRFRVHIVCAGNQRLVIVYFTTVFLLAVDKYTGSKVLFEKWSLVILFTLAVLTVSVP